METQKMVNKKGELVIIKQSELNYKDGELKTISQALIQRHPKLIGLRCLSIIERVTEQFDFKHIGQIERFFHV